MHNPGRPATQEELKALAAAMVHSAHTLTGFVHERLLATREMAPLASAETRFRELFRAAMNHKEEIAILVMAPMPNCQA